MKIAYLDLSPGIFEDYSLNPKRYGGGRIFASTLKQKSYFTIFAAFDLPKKLVRKQIVFWLVVPSCSASSPANLLIA
jgi:hypothetical protein